MRSRCLYLCCTNGQDMKVGSSIINMDMMVSTQKVAPPNQGINLTSFACDIFAMSKFVLKNRKNYNTKSAKKRWIVIMSVSEIFFLIQELFNLIRNMFSLINTVFMFPRLSLLLSHVNWLMNSAQWSKMYPFPLACAVHKQRNSTTVGASAILSVKRTTHHLVISLYLVVLF